MNVSIILGHPDSKSFNHALANVCKDQLIKNGHMVHFHDLYQEGFNPVLSDLNTEDTDENVNLHCKELSACDGIIIIHPNWWGQPPAIIKGWIDRVLKYNVAYKFSQNSDGKAITIGLLKNKTALVLNTSNTSEEDEKLNFNDPLQMLWEKRIFRTCGVEKFKRIAYHVIKDSSQTQREKWLSELSIYLNQTFPQL